MIIIYQNIVNIKCGRVEMHRTDKKILIQKLLFIINMIVMNI